MYHYGQETANYLEHPERINQKCAKANLSVAVNQNSRWLLQRGWFLDDDEMCGDWIEWVGEQMKNDVCKLII